MTSDMLTLNPSSEQEWRQTLATEAAQRAARAPFVELLTIAQDLPPALTDRIIDRAMTMLIDGTNTAIAVVEALRFMRATPETADDAADKLVDVACRTFADDPKRLSLVADPATVARLLQEEDSLSRSIYRMLDAQEATG